VRKISYNTCL